MWKIIRLAVGCMYEEKNRNNYRGPCLWQGNCGCVGLLGMEMNPMSKQFEKKKKKLTSFLTAPRKFENVVKII